MSSSSKPPEVQSPAEAEAAVDRAELRKANAFRERVRAWVRRRLEEIGDPRALVPAAVDDDEHTMRLLSVLDEYLDSAL